MADAGFFKGTSAEQDSRFANKQKKLLQQMKFPDNINVKIDMIKVNLDVMKPWITKRVQELLGVEDDVVIEFVFNQLEDKHPDPKMMQINLTGFLGGSKARLFIGELWTFLASAQTSPDGIPKELVELKKKELLNKQEDDDRLKEIRRREEESQKQIVKVELNKVENRRRSVDKTRPKSRPQPEKKTVRSSSESENDRRHVSRKSPTRKQRTQSSTSSSSPSSEDEKIERKKEKTKKRSPSNSPDERIEKKPSKKTNGVSNEKSKKPKRTRSASVSSSSVSIVEIEKPKKRHQSTRHRSRSRSSSNHRHKKSRKHDKYSSRRHQHETKRRDHRTESKQTKSHRHDSTNRTKYSKSPENNVRQRSSSPKKPRLESQIRVQTPPPSQEPSAKTSNRAERIIVLENSRSDRPTSLSSRISIVNKTTSHDESSEVHHSSEDENEIDLRERLLREKAIKSMKRRQSSSNNPLSNDISSKLPITERIVYQTQ